MSESKSSGGQGMHMTRKQAAAENDVVEARPEPKPVARAAAAPPPTPAPASPFPMFSVRWNPAAGAYELFAVENRPLNAAVALPSHCNESLEHVRKLSVELSSRGSA